MRLRLPIVPRGICITATLAVVLVFLFGVLRVELVTDITTLLPSRNDDAVSLTELARNLGLMKKVVVLVGMSDNNDAPVEERAKAMDRVCERIEKLDGTVGITSRVDDKEVRLAAETVLSHGPKLRGLNPPPLEEDEARERLKQLKKNLSTAEAMVTGAYMLKDPLGFSRDALKGLEAAAESMGAVRAGRLVSKDGRYLIAVVDIDFDPMDVDRSRRYVLELDNAVKEAFAGRSDLRAVHLGGAHFAASSASAIMADVRLAFILTSVLIVLVFVLLLRSIRFLPAALLPGGVGVVVATGSMGWLGVPLHALTLGFAATITGISVDYAIHLLGRAGFEASESRRIRMDRALEATWKPIALGCVTTVGAFALVATSGFTGIRQLAIFASISIPVAMLVTLLVLPSFHGLLLGKKEGTRGLFYAFVESAMKKEIGVKGRAIAVASFALAMGISVFGIARIEMSGDPRDLRNVDEALEKKEAVLLEAFPGVTGTALLVATGETDEAALRVNDLLYEKLKAAGIEHKEILSIAPFLPSKETQAISQKSVRGMFEGARAKEWFAAEGFKESYVRKLAAGVGDASLTAASYRGTSLEKLVKESLVTHGGQSRVVTRVRIHEERRLEMLEKLSEETPGVAIASERLEISRALTMLQRELVWMLGVWLGAALIVLSIVMRSPAFGLRAALPAMIGVAAAVGLFGFLGRPLTPVASAGVTLVMGLGIDYGIFMQSETGKKRGAVTYAVIASALTTLAGFGVLSLAATRAMADLGLIVLVGVTAALATAIWLIPALSTMKRTGNVAVNAAALLFTLLLVGCAAAKTDAGLNEKPNLKLRHQILFTSEQESHVFEGYMILSNDSFMVKAFAGPGVDLFTVVRGKDERCGALHIEGLKGKMDIDAVGDDIARVYLGGCEGRPGGGELTCQYDGESLVESYDPEGRLTTRVFPDAHGIGLKIRYEEHSGAAGSALANRITLTWGAAGNRMVIKTVDVETTESTPLGCPL